MIGDPVIHVPRLIMSGGYVLRLVPGTGAPVFVGDPRAGMGDRCLVETQRKHRNEHGNADNIVQSVVFAEACRQGTWDCWKKVTSGI